MKKIFFSFATVGTEESAVHDAIIDFENHFFEVGPPESLIKYEAFAGKLAHETSALLHCSPDEIVYTKNTTEGIIIATETLPLDPGDEVLVLENEYRANFIPWLKKRNEGIEVRVIEGSHTEEALERLIDAVGPKTKVIAISWIQYHDGYVVDLDRLSKVCEKNNIFLFVDAVQGIGVHAIDLQKTPVAMLACGGQKYLRAGTGSGFLYVNRKIMNSLRCAKVGIRSVQKASPEGYLLKESAERFEDGTMNIKGVVALHTAIELVNKTGIKNIEKKNKALLGDFKKILRERKVPFIDHGDRQGNIITLIVPEPKEMVEALRNQNIYIKYLREMDLARISFHHTSSKEDFIVLANAIQEWLKKNDLPDVTRKSLSDVSVNSLH
jgi:cysteine desulfurase/selenocysteine lyase